MKVDIAFTNLKHYKGVSKKEWFWHYSEYTFIQGFKMRICGVYINVRENNATEKLIEIGKNKMPS